MLHGLFIVSLVGNVVQAAKEAFAKPVPAENWANKDLYYKDMMNGVSAEQLVKNLENGKYKGEVKEVKKYPEPHRAADGRIAIENCDLYEEDVKKYGAYQAHQWAKQGRYNLTPEELEKEREKYRERFKKLYGL